MQNLQQLFGNIDIYLFDQLLKGRYEDCRTVLDAGCGGGRNLIYLLQNGYEVHGVDNSPKAIKEVKALAKSLNARYPLKRFLVSPVENLPFEDAKFDLVICSAVLHFAQNKPHFEQMLQELWRVLKPGGYLFIRLASDIGIESLVLPEGEGRYLLPDGTQRYLVNEAQLLGYTRQLGGTLYEPIKTTNVQNLRCMTTWCILKPQ